MSTTLSDAQTAAAKVLRDVSADIAASHATTEAEVSPFMLAGMARVIAATLTPAEMRALAANLTREACLRESMDRSQK